MSHKAFTLIETLVAISVLLVSLVGPLSIAAKALQSAYYARDEVTASYLAQEGIEYVRALRDQNYLNGQPWLTGISDCIGVACAVDFPNFTHTLCTNGVCTPLLISPTTGLYNVQSGSASPYTRTLTLTQVSPTEVKIDVTITWMSAAISRQIRLTEFISDWL